MPAPQTSTSAGLCSPLICDSASVVLPPAEGIFCRLRAPRLKPIKGAGVLAAGWVSHKQIKVPAAFLFRLIWKCHVVSKVEPCFIHVQYAFASQCFFASVEEPEAERRCGENLLFFCGKKREFK